MIAKVFRTMFNGVQTLTSSRMNLLSTAEATLQLAALQERCILVDSYDKSIGDATKKECHIVNPDGQVLLHRAFSVFLFNNKGELLLQKRSATKVTFPNHYTNTCCSHPLFEISEETEEHDAIGIRRAARRRLNYELGIPLSQISISDFVYLTRIHYFAVESEWGEHEIDYVLFIQKDNLKLDPNPDEISELCWISQSEINNFVKNLNAPLTPWFKLILENKLPEWWNNLHSLKKLQDHNTIQRFV
ncbi:isopentenyl-diphosphate Delta-isomerase 1 isoform X1 [Apis laboriosa]|uniref:isopentenyl-diphosphate Delta-isomerase 1 isoform X1 n=2 Tax=Apis laboriosa TaxID=183418 RepID=UPI001CC44DE7|nr:isopentenyl-diphosphate Delta-isomerase 1 isoform X1 [Apis laboriosa]